MKSKRTISLARQIAHIRQYQEKFNEIFNCGQYRSVEDYFHDYHGEYLDTKDHLYWCVCQDMGIVPHKGIPE